MYEELFIMIKLEKLRDLLLSGSLLSKHTFDIDDIEQLLDNRDISVFDNEWIRNYNEIKAMKTSIPPEVNKLVESIREIAFKITYDSTESSDLASYISDDFGLIAEALFLNYNDDWLNALLKEYTKSKVPHNTLIPLKGKLEEFILEIQFNLPGAIPSFFIPKITVLNNACFISEKSPEETAFSLYEVFENDIINAS